MIRPDQRDLVVVFAEYRFHVDHGTMSGPNPDQLAGANTNVPAARGDQSSSTADQSEGHARGQSERCSDLATIACARGPRFSKRCNRWGFARRDVDVVKDRTRLNCSSWEPLRKTAEGTEQIAAAPRDARRRW
jgi:hypothetical protein